jgi:hypothetical protein
MWRVPRIFVLKIEDSEKAKEQRSFSVHLLSSLLIIKPWRKTKSRETAGT